jgi:hypothetical protein
MAIPSLVNVIADPSEAKDNAIPVLGLIGDLQVDVLSSEELMLESVITERPVEAGFDVTDARVKKPVMLRMEGILTDTQLTPQAIAGGFIAGEGFNLQTWRQKKDMLLEFYDLDELISITLPLHFYPSVQIKSLKIEQRAGRTNAAFFILEAKTLRIVSSEITSVDSSQIPKEIKDKESASNKEGSKKSGKKKDGGNKSGEAVSAEKEQSWALQFANTLGLGG